jgi:3-methylfumaryl-CoA hydratase
VETQTYILLEESKDSTKLEKMVLPPIIAKYQKQFTPDETLLFQYSALGFNSHKIHLDRNYAQKEEGLPDLVVNGGLATLLMTEFARNELGLNLTEIKVKHLVPLYCSRPLTIVSEENELKIFDDKNELVVVMEVQ